MALVLRTKQTTSSLVDTDWEFIDPNPDIIALFQQFDQKFFAGRLVACEVKWSSRMTVYANDLSNINANFSFM